MRLPSRSGCRSFGRRFSGRAVKLEADSSKARQALLASNTKKLNSRTRKAAGQSRRQQCRRATSYFRHSLLVSLIRDRHTISKQSRASWHIPFIRQLGDVDEEPEVVTAPSSERLFTYRTPFINQNEEWEDCGCIIQKSRAKSRVSWRRGPILTHALMYLQVVDYTDDTPSLRRPPARRVAAHQRDQDNQRPDRNLGRQRFEVVGWVVIVS